MTIKTVEEFYRELQANHGVALEFTEGDAVEFYDAAGFYAVIDNGIEHGTHAEALIAYQTGRY